MTEDDARAWVAPRFGADAVARLQHFVDAVVAESALQNLVSRSTLPTIWARHVVDSAQLLALATPGATWVDIGTGAGFPGMVVALLTDAPMVMVEPRRRRADFLDAFARSQGLDHVTVVVNRVETMTPGVTGVISARAVASVSDIFAMTRHLTGRQTRYLLPRGQSIRGELESAKAHWRGMFHVEPSMTDPDSGILVASDVRPR